MVARSDYESFVAHLFNLASDIGIRPAARALGISEERAKKIAQRRKFNISLIRPQPQSVAAGVPSVPECINAKASILALDGDRTRLAMARTARRAFEHSDQLSDEQLHELPRSVAMEKHAKVAQIAHGWNQAQSTVAVQVNVPLPDEAERSEMRSIDAKLDAIAAKLKD